MPRPRYQINATDWLDCLDWLDHQLSQPTWLTQSEHPVHEFGLKALKECVVQWRDIDRPTDDLCQSAQGILESSLTMDDWGRMRKSLSARKRRRREKRSDSKTVNITLTPAAHQALTELRDLSGAATFSDAIENHLQCAMTDLRKGREAQLIQQLKDLFRPLPASKFVKLVESYLALAQEKRSLANSCKIAQQLFMKRPERDTLKLVRDRFIEDLIWNELHLGVNYSEIEPITELVKASANEDPTKSS